MKTLILIIFVTLIGVPMEKISDEENTKIFLPKCKGNACDAVQLYWDDSQNGYVFKNKHGNNKNYQLGNSIQLKVYYSPGKSPFASCSAIKKHKLKYAGEWNIGDVMLCSDKSFTAVYIVKKYNPDDSDFKL
ncbi:hypothetical protein [Lacinutrix sp. MEBiC02404]